MALADWIMRAATRNPPAGREDWARAMQAEYAALAGDKLSWAIGCLTATLGWRLREDGFYLVMLIATVILLDFTNFWMWLLMFMPRRFEIFLVAELNINLWLTLMLLAAIALNALNPRRPFLTGLTLIAMQKLGFEVALWGAPREFQMQASAEPLHIYNAPPFVAHFAEVGVCFVGALIGCWIAGLWQGDEGSRRRRFALGKS